MSERKGRGIAVKVYEPIMQCEYGQLADKVCLDPDYFTGFDPARRKEIVTQEAKFYRSITDSFSVDDQLEKKYIDFPSYDGAQIAMKYYLPLRHSDKKRPVLVFIHGGGYKTCSVETHDFVPSYLAANADLVAFSVEYRLAPEYKFPVGLYDCYEAIRWVFAHAEQFGIDTARIAVGGDSGGGNFSAALAILAKQRGEFTLDKQVLIYPATDMSGTVKKKSASIYAPIGGNDSPNPYEEYTGTGADLRNPLLSPMLAEDHSGLPKALFIEAECDPLVDDGLIYANLLQQAGVEVEYHVYKGMPHAFILRTYTETFDALNKICNFLKA